MFHRLDGAIDRGGFTVRGLEIGFEDERFRPVTAAHRAHLARHDLALSLGGWLSQLGWFTNGNILSAKQIHAKQKTIVFCLALKTHFDRAKFAGSNSG